MVKQRLEGLWDMENVHIQLVGMENGADTLEEFTALLQ